MGDNHRSSPANSDPTTSARPSTLSEIALLFLKLGIIAFGGPAAHIAMMEDEVVRRRSWLSREQFLDLVAASNLIPGPNSTEAAIHIGYMKEGWPGLLVAGCCFILPATLIVSGLAWVYVQFGTLPQAERLLYGVKPVIIAIVLQALWRLGSRALKNWYLALLGMAGAALSLAGLNELLLLLGAGLLCGAVRWITERRPMHHTMKAMLGPLSVSSLFQTASVTGAASFGLWPLFLFFLKVGSVLFGSGYVLLAFLRADLVQRWGWLTESQLIDAVAVGQVTPGPVFTTATFIGYVLGGSKGALIATIGIFLPAFVFVGLSGPLVARIRKSAVAGAALDGVVVASLALMAVVTLQLARAALVDLVTWGLAASGLLLLVRFKLNSAWLVIGGAVTGLLIFVIS